MKPVVLALACMAAPAFAQASGATQIESEGRGLINNWIALFNKGDAAALAGEVYLRRDEASLVKLFEGLRADSFGKLDVYSADFCGSDADHGKALVKFARIYTFGGKMNDDEAKVFDLVKTPAGWRISGEADTEFGKPLAC